MTPRFPPNPAWRRTRALFVASSGDGDSTVQSDAPVRARTRRSPSSSSLWRRVTDWLAGDMWQPAESASAAARLPAARDALARELADIQTAEAQRLVLRIGAAPNRQELLHLRMALFELVARVHSQAEAQTRLDRLAAHFPLSRVRVSRH